MPHPDHAASRQIMASRIMPAPDIESSVISRAFYDAFTRELDIVFTSGQPYRYFDVPTKVYRQFIDAASKGEFFNAHIRDRYQFERL